MLLLVILITQTTVTFAQIDAASGQKKKDSIMALHLEHAAIRYPVLRQVNISTDVILSGAVKSKFNNQDLYKSQLQTNRFRGNFNVPLASVGKNLISSSIGLLVERMNLNNNEKDPLLQEGKAIDKNTLSFQLAVSRSDSLFKRPIVYNVGVTVLTNGSFSQRRLILTGLFSISLFRTANTTLSLGALLAVDPSSPSPVVPFVSYFHNFNALHIELYADFPSRLIFRRQLSFKSAVSVGSNLGGNLTFLNINQVGLPQNAIHTILDLKTGILYEYRITRKMVLGINAGVYSTLRSNLLDEKADRSNPFIESKNSSVPFVNMSVSFLPFWKGFVK